MVTDNSSRTEFLLKALHLPASNTRMAELCRRKRFSACTIRQQAGDAFQVEIIDYH